MATLHKHFISWVSFGLAGLLAAASAVAQTSLDMEIQKTLTPSSYTPGVSTPVTYTVTVKNLGPGTAIKAPIKDIQPPGMTFSSWTCTTTGAGNGCWKGASLAATQSGTGSVLPLTAGLPPFPGTDVDSANGVAVDLVAGATATFLFSAIAGPNAYDLNTPAVNGFQYPQGYILNAASVRRPLGTVQAASSGQDNVTAVFEPELSGDVGVAKSSSIANYTPGSATNVTYTFLVTNFSAGSPLAAIPVIDAQPAGVTFNSWSCAITFVGIGAAGSNVCPASGSGSINTTVDLKPTAVATFTVNATISAGRTGQVCNTITSGFPAGVIVVQTLPDNPDSATACINPVPITVTINKTVTGAPATGAPGTYNFSISCQTPTATYPASITLAGATLTGSTTVSVPAGSTNCVATETGVPGAPTNYTWGSPTITGGTMATPLFANATVGVNNPLTRNNVAVTITKNITGVAASVITGNLTFPFTLTCPGTVGSPFSGTVTVNAGTLTGTSAAINVPAGATNCAILEGTQPATPTNYTWGSPSYTQPPATLPASGTAAGTITNPLVPNPGTLTVNKTVTGAPAGGAPGAYAFSVNCSNPTATYTGSVTINGTGTTGSTTVINIPAGTTGCSIVETSTANAPTTYSWGSPSYAQPAATALAAGGSISGTITNPLTRNNVVVTANKTVSGVTGNGTNFPFAAATSFPFTVTCTGNPGGSYAGTMTVAAGATTGTGTVSVPQGSTGCTASEGALPTAPTNYTWGTPVLTGTPLVTPLSAAATVGVNNPLTRNNVAVTITKNITGVAASVITGNLTFPFTLTCPGTVGSPFSGTVTVNAGTLTGTSAAINVPAGATGCTIAEGTLPTAPTNYTWGSPSYTQPPATLPATGTAAGTITNPLTRNNVVVTANKTVSGVTGNGTNFPFAAATSFPFTVTCTGNPGGSYAGTMTVAAGATTGTGTVSVPQGSTGCTASEGALPTAPTNYTWGTPVLTGTPLVTPLSAAATVGVNNPLTRNNVAVTITKNITGVAASVITGNLTFPFTLTCPGTVGSPFSGTVTVNAGTLTGTSAAINVPAGATGCTIAEGTLPTAPTNYTWGSPSYTQPPATLPATGTAAGTITNPLTRNNVVVTANKTVSGVTGNGTNFPFAAATSFPFTVTCTGNPGGSYAGTMTVAAGATTGTGTVSVPQGSTGCTASEGALPTAPTNYTWGTPVLTGTPLVTPLSAAATVGVNNPLTRNNVAVTITKNITGVAASVITGNLTFPFTLTCPGTVGSPFSGTVTVNAGTLAGTSAAINVPAGATGCTIAEGTLPTAPTNYTWGSPSYTQPPATLPATGTAAGTITNPLTRNNVVVTANKTVSGVTGNGTNFPFAAATSFPFTVTCTGNPGGSYAGTMTVAAGATTGTGTVSVPQGSTGCTASEGALPTAPTNYTWGTPVLTGTPLVTPLSAAATVGVNNPLTRNNVAVTITKNITGVAASVITGNLTFPFTLTCPGTVGSPFSGTVTVNAGTLTGTSAAINVPAGATGCTIAEGTLPTAPTNYTWGSPSYTQPPATLPATGTAAGTITNPLTRNNVVVTANKTVSGVTGNGTNFPFAAATSFPFTVTCTGNPGGSYAGTMTVAAGATTGTGTVSVPQGSTGCTASEGALPTAPTNYTWGTPVLTGTPLVTPLSAAATVGVNNPLTRNNVAVTITKNITGVAASVITGNLTFPFTLTCPGTVGSPFSGTVTVNAGTLTGTSAAINVPAGATGCTIAEGTLPTPPTFYIWGTATYTQPVATLPATGTATAAITNPLIQNAPNITVAKTITSAGIGSPVQYLVTVTNSGGPGTYTLTDTPLLGSGVTLGAVTCANTTVPAAGGAPNCAGAAPYSLAAAGTAIAGGASHTYTVSIPFTVTNAVTPTAGSALCPASAPTTSNGGLNNATTVTPNSGNASTVNVCRDITPNAPNITVAKTITSAGIGSPVQYLVTVTNSGGPGTYTLTDTPLLGSGVTLGAVTCANTTVPAAGGAPNCAGAAPYSLAAAGTAIAGGASHTYTVSIPFTVTNAVTPTAGSALCPASAPTTSNGGLNNATTVTPNSGNASTVNVCRDITPNAPNITVAKTITSAGIGSPVQYLVTVTNSGGPGTYTLTDTPLLGSGVTLGAVTCANTTVPAAGGAPNCAGAAPYSLAAAGTAIAGGASHTYTVSIPFTVTNAVTPTAGSALCPASAPTTSNGGLNNATTVTPNSGNASTVNVCRDITPNAPNITVAKTITSAGIGSPVQYLVTVTNSGGPGTYTLTDTPLLGSGVTLGAVTCANTTVPAAGGAPNCAGAAPYSLAAAGTAIAGGASHTYTVSIPFTVTNAVTPTAGSALCPASAPTTSNGGLNNATTVTPNSGNASTVNVCRDITPNAPNITVAKTITSAGIGSPVQYLVTVTNSGGPGTYTLTDTPLLGSGVTLGAVTCANTTVPAAGGAPNCAGAAPYSLAAAGTAIAGGASHTYTVSIPFTVTNAVTPTAGSALCPASAPTTSNGGLNNATTVTPNSGNASTVNVCRDITPNAPNITVAKTITSAGIGSPVQYLVTVTNSGGPGTYTLTDTPLLGSGVTLGAVTCANTTVPAAGGAPNCAGAAPYSLAAAGTAIAGGASHTYTVSIPFTVTNAVTPTAGSALCPASAPTTSNGGLNNATTVTPNSGNASTVNVCRDITPNAPNITVAKTITSAGIGSPVQYLVTVTNSGGPGTYTLTDTPLLGSGVTLGAVTCANTTVPAAGGAPNCAGAAPYSLAAAGTAIAGGASHTYTVSIPFTVTNAVTPTAGSALCPASAPTTSNGGLNNATTVTPNSGNASTVNVCRDITPNAPNITVAKTITSAGIGSPVQYLVTVTNSGGPGTYTLTDTPLLGSGVTLGAVTCANTTVPAAGGAPNCAGAAPYSLAAAGTAIAGGASHTYTVSIPFTVTNAVTPTAGSALCPASAPTTSNGGLNNATTVTPNSGNASTVNVCRDITPNAPNITVAKTITSAGIGSPVQYLVTVTNSGGPGTYTLTDTPLLGSGVTLGAVTCANTTVPAAGGAPNCAGAAPYSLAAAGTAIAGGASHTYTVSIPFTVTNAVTPTAGSALCPASAPTTSNGGLNNATTVTPNSGNASTVNVCRDITPNAPAITVTKTVLGTNRLNSVQYVITVTNSGGAGAYGLTDVPLFGSGLPINSVTCVNTTAPVAGGTPTCGAAAPYTLADVGTAIAGGATHSYVVTISYTITEAVTNNEGSALCASGNPPGPGGLHNVATVTPSTASAVSVYACVSVAPPVTVPTTNRFVLLMLALALAAFGWQSTRRFR